MINNKGNSKFDWHNKELLSSYVANSTTKSEVLLKIGLTPSSSMVTLRKYLSRYDLDTSHFDAHRDRPNTKNGSTRPPIEEYLTIDSKIERSALRRRLIKENVLPYKCSGVGCSVGDSWLEKSISLQLEHKNGINNDNRIENLEFLCPNCHSQTSTFAGRNKQR